MNPFSGVILAQRMFGLLIESEAMLRRTQARAGPIGRSVRDVGRPWWQQPLVVKLDSAHCAGAGPKSAVILILSDQGLDIPPCSFPPTSPEAHCVARVRKV